MKKVENFHAETLVIWEVEERKTFIEDLYFIFVALVFVMNNRSTPLIL